VLAECHESRTLLADSMSHIPVSVQPAGYKSLIPDPPARNTIKSALQQRSAFNCRLKVEESTSVASLALKEIKRHGCKESTSIALCRGESIVASQLYIVALALCSRCSVQFLRRCDAIV